MTDCQFPNLPVTVEGTTIDQFDGRGPQFRFRVTYEGAFSCTHPDLDSLLAHHPADRITIKEPSR